MIFTATVSTTVAINNYGEPRGTKLYLSLEAKKRKEKMLNYI